MPADGPLEQRLTDGARFMRVIADRMEKLAEEVAKLQRDATICEKQAVFDARREQINAELERDAAVEHARVLEDAIEDMRQGIRGPQEVIECALRDSS